MKNSTFTVTEEHLELLKNMVVGWDDGEFGAPAIDCKRPYGNGGVYEDMAEILKIPIPDVDEDEDYTEEELDRMDEIHAEMKTVLQILVTCGTVAIGTYEENAFYYWERQKTQHNADIDIINAIRALKCAMGGDGGSYAHAVHCNLAMLCNDAIINMRDDTPNIVGNYIASSFMRTMFDVETKK